MGCVKSAAGGQPRRALPPLLVTREEAAAAVTLSVPTFLKAVREGRMPPPRQLSTNRVGWLWSELEASAAALPASTLLPPSTLRTEGERSWFRDFVESAPRQADESGLGFVGDAELSA